MAEIKKGWAFFDGDDNEARLALTDSRVYLVEKELNETPEQATVRVRARINIIRVLLGQVKNLVVVSAPLGTITGFQAVAQSATVVRLTLAAFAGAAAYERQISLNGLSWTALPDTTSLVDDRTGLVASTPYFFQCRAKNSAGLILTGWALATATTKPVIADPPPPPPPLPVVPVIEPLPASAVVVAYKQAWLLDYAQNGTPDMNTINLLFNATTDEPLKVRLLKSGAIVNGTTLLLQAGAFNATDKSFAIGNYEQRIRLDRVSAGVGGVAVGEVIDVLVFRESAPTDVMQLQWTVAMPVTTSPVSLPIPSNPTGTTTDSPHSRTGTAAAFLGTKAVWSAAKKVFRDDPRLTFTIVLNAAGTKFQLNYTSVAQPPGTRVFRFRIQNRPYLSSSAWSGKWFKVGEPLSIKLFEVEPGIDPQYWSNFDHGTTANVAIQLITFKRLN